MSDLSKLIADLEVEATTTPREIRAVVSKGALNVKNEWRDRARGIQHAPRYPQSISYDLHGLSAEIGPEDSPENQGFLGHILETGGAHNSPGNHGAQALEAEFPRFAQAIADLAGRHLT